MQRIALLGMGRMGAAMGRRLAGTRQVTGWTRSGRTVDGVATVAGPADAVADADLVLLALYDGAACREVLDRIRAALPAGTHVVNTSTIAPEEAVEFSRELGSRYVHAPVLGSVPAADSGSLVVLAGRTTSDDPANVVLGHLGEVLPVGDAKTAAALKLVANASLAGSVVALRQTIHQARALGLSLGDALDVLQRGPLGGLVQRKRRALDGGPTPVEFAVGALAKDMDLLASATGYPLGAASETGPDDLDPDSDIAQAVVTSPTDAAVLAPLYAYIRGHTTGDPRHFREAFLPTAHVEGLRDGAFVSWPLSQYLTLFNGTPALDEATRSRTIDAVTVRRSVATAWMTLHHGDTMFTDVFLLVHTEDGWRIANKAYHRHMVGASDPATAG